MNSFISWIGGKRLLRNQIMEQFPEPGTYGRYIEVFGGAGWVLFAKDRFAPMEVYNDSNGDLVNLFRVVKYHPEALQKELEWIVTSREIFFDSIQEVRGLTDIQRAARFWIAIKESYGSECRSFGVKASDLPKAVQFMSNIHNRLKNVVIENSDFERVIKTYDRPDALFYLDPPYYKSENYYTAIFSKEDHGRLKQCLDNIRGKFVLSYNDCKEIRELYGGYKMIEVERQNSLKINEKGNKYKELIIKNY